MATGNSTSTTKNDKAPAEVAKDEAPQGFKPVKLYHAIDGTEITVTSPAEKVAREWDGYSTRKPKK